MQTFLPYPDLRKSVRCLDWRRLGKQRVEAFQIALCLTRLTKENCWRPDGRWHQFVTMPRSAGNGWRRHPAVIMWEGHVPALLEYMDLCIDEWVRRGYQNNMRRSGSLGYSLPDWFNERDPHPFHSSCRGRLLFKDSAHYATLGWSETAIPDEVGYVWPLSRAKLTSNLDGEMEQDEVRGPVDTERLIEAY